MKITCISDTHQHHKKIVMPVSDMIIHAGDFSYRGTIEETENFLKWYQKQDAKYKLLICGNHEVEIGQDIDKLREICKQAGVILLHNETVIIEGIKIFGSPYSVRFRNWAFGLPDESLKDIWDTIPYDTNILITHGPAYNVLDKNMAGMNCGSMSLRKELLDLEYVDLHICGHIHESRGVHVSGRLTTVNASICGIPYTDVLLNPITVEI